MTERDRETIDAVALLAFENHGLCQRGEDRCAKCGKRIHVPKWDLPYFEIKIEGVTYVCCGGCISELEDQWADAIGQQLEMVAGT